MRLIDVDSLLANMDKGMQGTAREYLKFYQMSVNDEPTAYDVDIVVERLEERKKYLQNEFLLADKAKEVKGKTFARINEIDGMIDIVRSGGIECRQSRTDCMRKEYAGLGRNGRIKD